MPPTWPFSPDLCIGIFSPELCIGLHGTRLSLSARPCPGGSGTPCSGTFSDNEAGYSTIKTRSQRLPRVRRPKLAAY